MLRFCNVFVKRIHAQIKPNCLWSSHFSNHEPTYMVDSDETVPAESVKVPFLSEDVKMEMFNKYIKQPDVWTVQKLSQHYGASIQRVSAVLYLINKRMDAMVAAGVESNSSPASVDELKIYDKFCEDKKQPLEGLVDVFEQKYEVAEIKRIVNKWEQHNKRLQNVAEYDAYMKEMLERFEDEDIDTSFQETPTANPTSLQDKFYPELFGDDAFAQQRETLLRRVAAETKGTPSDDILHLLTRSKEQAASISSPFGESESKGRWKFAFRDLSFTNYKPPATPIASSRGGSAMVDTAGSSAVPSSSSPPPPPHLAPLTVVRTRTGRLRNANAIEEAMRSWSRKHPTALDRALNRAKLAVFDDFDKDAQVAQQIVTAKRARNKTLKAAGTGK